MKDINIKQKKQCPAVNYLLCVGTEPGKRTQGTYKTPDQSVQKTIRWPITI